MTLEMPKSMTFTTSEPSARRVRKRFPGLRSRWTDAGRVRLGEALAHLERVEDGGVHRQPAPLAEQGAEVDPLEVFEHEVGLAGLEDPGVVDAGHVLAAHPRRRAPLPEEALERVGTHARAGQEELDGDPLAQVQVPRRTTNPIPPRPITRSTRYFPARIWPTRTGALEGRSFARERSMIGAEVLQRCCRRSGGGGRMGLPAIDNIRTAGEPHEDLPTRHARPRSSGDLAGSPLSGLSCGQAAKPSNIRASDVQRRHGGAGRRWRISPSFVVSGLFCMPFRGSSRIP